MSDATSQEPPPQFQMQVPSDKVTGCYADFVNIWHTPDVFILDFATLVAAPAVQMDPVTGQPAAIAACQMISRVRIPPKQVFEVMKALEQQLSAWERETGGSAPTADN